MFFRFVQGCSIGTGCLVCAMPWSKGREMGLPKPALQLLALEHKRKAFEGTVVTLGRQCVYATLSECEEILSGAGIAPRELLGHYETQTQIPSWRGTRRERNTSDRAFFSLLGIDDCIALDCNDFEHAEIVFDLNNPLEDQLHSRADILVDGGTLEHVFDVRQALANVSLMLRPGGRVIHMSPANNFANHGFYQFSPTLYADYYRANRFENVRVFVIEDRVRRGESVVWDIFELDTLHQPLMMTSASSRRMLTLCIAEKGKASTIGIPPIQSLYEIEFEKIANRSSDDLSSQQPKLWFNRLAKRLMPGSCYFALRSLWSRCRPHIFGDPTQKPWGLKHWKTLR